MKASRHSGGSGRVRVAINGADGSYETTPSNRLRSEGQDCHHKWYRSREDGGLTVDPSIADRPVPSDDESMAMACNGQGRRAMTWTWPADVTGSTKRCLFEAEEGGEHAPGPRAAGVASVAVGAKTRLQARGLGT